jgi:hypothetical protein
VRLSWPFRTADWERRLAPFDAPWRNWEQEEEAVVMFTPQGKVGWNGWSTPSPSNQRAGGGAPPASAPLGKAKGTSQRAAELEEEVRPAQSFRFFYLLTHLPNLILGICSFTHLHFYFELFQTRPTITCTVLFFITCFERLRSKSNSIYLNHQLLQVNRQAFDNLGLTLLLP